MSADQTLFHLAIDSHFENIEVVQVVLSDVLARLGLPKDSCHWIDIAVREAVANAIKHGNRQEVGKKVMVDLSLEQGDMVIRIHDQGEGFDPAKLADPLNPANLLKPSGRGIFYMRSFMDSVEVERAADGGTLVTLKKKGPFPSVSISNSSEPPIKREERSL